MISFVKRKRYFSFSDGWEERWVLSKHRSDYGKFRIGSGKFYGDREKDIGKIIHFSPGNYETRFFFGKFSSEFLDFIMQFYADIHIGLANAKISA